MYSMSVASRQSSQLSVTFLEPTLGSSDRLVGWYFLASMLIMAGPAVLKGRAVVKPSSLVFLRLRYGFGFALTVCLRCETLSL